MKCEIHPDLWYIGSTTDLKKRWANHKSDILRAKTVKCATSKHVAESPHPNDPTLSFIKIIPIDSVKDPSHLLRTEMWWQCNIGTLYKGLNSRIDFQSAKRINYKKC